MEKTGWTQILRKENLGTEIQLKVKWTSIIIVCKKIKQSYYMEASRLSAVIIPILDVS